MFYLTRNTYSEISLLDFFPTKLQHIKALSNCESNSCSVEGSFRLSSQEGNDSLKDKSETQCSLVLVLVLG